MKNGKKATREQRKLLLEKGYDASEWLVVKDTPREMVLVSRDKRDTITVKKFEY